MEKRVHPGSIVILDFGGQYAHLIGNRVRRLGGFSEIRVAETPAKELKGAAGIILSGGPQSVYEKGSPQADPAIFDLNIPILGLCYGHQWLAQARGGKVRAGKVKEYGMTRVARGQPFDGLRAGSGQRRQRGQRGGVFRDLPDEMSVWMSHGDEVAEVPEGFQVTASSEACRVAAMSDEKRKLYGIQFHIEVTHTEHGMDILKNFVDICRPAPWSVEGFAERIGAEIKREVGDRKVFMLVSGGVDSTVAFTLLNKVLGTKRVQGLLVDTGLMRKNEVALIQKAMKKEKIGNLRVEDASAEFFKNLKGVFDPEQKRKIIGDTFLSVQKRVSDEMGLTADEGWLLGQGTIYPDTIETGGTTHADHIKTHHNRVPAIERMIDQGLVTEPLKDLYKDEVRTLGEELGLPHDLVWRHPFPGPGLGVRILCAEKPSPVMFPDAELEERARDLLRMPHVPLPIKSVGVQGDGRTYRHAVAVFSHHPHVVTPEHVSLATTIPNAIPVYNRVLLCTSHDRPVEFHVTPGFLNADRADLLREADAIVDDEMRAAKLYESIWQFPVVLLPFGTVKGKQSIVLRPIASTDAMTANAVVLPESVLAHMTERILKLGGVDAVFVDLTNKPPATIEWE